MYVEGRGGGEGGGWRCERWERGEVRGGWGRVEGARYRGKMMIATTQTTLSRGRRWWWGGGERDATKIHDSPPPD